MNGFFQEIARTNKAFCESLGLDGDVYDRPLSDAEANGTPLSADEVLIANERRWLVDRGMTEAKAAVWTPINVRQGISNEPHAVIEYAVKTDRNELFAVALGQFYAECRRRTIAPVFCGD